MLTRNETRIIRLLATTKEILSINAIAKNVRTAPNGAYKTLNKLEKESIIKSKIVGNMKTYKLNFEDEKTKRVLELSFIPKKKEERIKQREADLIELKKITKVCILFGSYITKKKLPHDLDVLVVLEKEDFNDYKKTLEKVQERTPLKIHDVVQTKDDVINNIVRGDAIISIAIQIGVVLWGYDTLVEVIKNVQ